MKEWRCRGKRGRRMSHAWWGDWSLEGLLERGCSVERVSRGVEGSSGR